MFGKDSMKLKGHLKVATKVIWRQLKWCRRISYFEGNTVSFYRMIIPNAYINIDLLWNEIYFSFAILDIHSVLACTSFGMLYQRASRVFSQEITSSRGRLSNPITFSTYIAVSNKVSFLQKEFLHIGCLKITIWSVHIFLLTSSILFYQLFSIF